MSKHKNHPLSATVERGMVVVRIGVNVLAHAAAQSDWAHRFNEIANAYVREFAIIDAPLFAKEVVSALLDEDEDGSSLLTDVLDKASQAALDDGAESCEFDVGIHHGRFDPRETWSAGRATRPTGGTDGVGR